MQVLLAISMLCFPSLLGAWGLLPLGYALVLCGIARSRAPLVAKIVVALLLWAALPAARALSASPELRAATAVLAVVWAGLAYSSLYLLVERSRAHDKPRLAEDLFYLLALPRLVEPFFQPISPDVLRDSERGDAVGRTAPLGPDSPARSRCQTVDHVPRGLALGLYGAALSVAAALLVRNRPDSSEVAQFVVDLTRHYCVAASQIFVAVSLFRLLGFDLSSGYRAPFLAWSFADFFRRWNHYVRDAVLSLFYYPLLGSLRGRLPRRAATVVAALLAIAAGSLLANDLLVPLATNPNPASVLGRAAHPVRLAALVVYWCAIVLPVAVFGTRVRPPSGRVARALATLRFLAGYFALWATAWWLMRGP
jgi:hypothetical protein